MFLVEEFALINKKNVISDDNAGFYLINEQINKWCILMALCTCKQFCQVDVWISKHENSQPRRSVRSKAYF